MSGNVNNLPNGILKSEFNQLINQSVFFNKETKNKLDSIFQQVAGDDSEISAEEWSNFASSIDTDNDGKLSEKEAAKAQNLYRHNKNAISALFYMIKNYIARLNNPDNTRQDGSREVLYTETNPHRANTSGNGTFEGGWIQYDQYGSATYEEWLENNGYIFNQELADELDQNAQRHNDLNGQCAQAFRVSAQDTTAISTQRYDIIMAGQDDADNQIYEDDVLNGGIVDNKVFNDMELQGSGYKYASELSNNPYFKELPHNIVATMDLRKLPKGCAIVYDGGYKETINPDDGSKNYHEHGHIAITDGTGKDSGGGHYNIVTGKQKTHIRVFVPIVIPETKAELYAKMRGESITEILPTDEITPPDAVNPYDITKRIQA